MTKLKVAVVCRTIGLEYDDRIRKECISIAKNAEVKIFVTFENNKREEGITSYGVPYESFNLTTREKISSGKLLLVKALEFYLKVKPQLKLYDFIWAHEEYTLLFSLFAPKNKFIWDLHEIPQLFERPILRWLFHYIEKKSKHIIHANEFRINYLIDCGVITQLDKHKYLRNFPDSNFRNANLEPDNCSSFLNWLNGAEYVYLQGLTVADRYPYNSIASIIESTDLKIVVVGSFEDLVSQSKLKNTFGSLLIERVFFAGRVNQLAVPFFLKNAKFSMIFYDNSIPNNEYCEANRFYQAINFGIPVITGSNISMSSLVKDLGLGVFLESDGRDIDQIKRGINLLLANYQTYRNNCLDNMNNFVWKDDDVNTSWYLE
jgi:hypothetical protein